MRRSLPKPSILAAGLVIALSSRLADAQTPVDDARRMFNAGMDALEHNDLDTACSNFRASLALDRRVVTLIKAGACLRRENRFVEAWNLLQEAHELHAANTGAFQQTIADDIRRELKQIPTLRLDISPAPDGLSVTLDGVSIAAADHATPRPVAQGRHVVRVEAPGYEKLETPFEVAGEGALKLQLSLKRNGPPPPDPTPPPTTTPGLITTDPVRAERDTSSGQRNAAYIVGGIGTATLAVAGMLGVMTLMRVGESNPHCEYPDGSCNPDGVRLRNEALRLQTAGLITAATGALALSTGVFLLVTSGTEGRARGTLAQSRFMLHGSTTW